MLLNRIFSFFSSNTRGRGKNDTDCESSKDFEENVTGIGNSNVDDYILDIQSIHCSAWRGGHREGEGRSMDHVSGGCIQIRKYSENAK